MGFGKINIWKKYLQGALTILFLIYLISRLRKLVNYFCDATLVTFEYNIN